MRSTYVCAYFASNLIHKHNLKSRVKKCFKPKLNNDNINNASRKKIPCNNRGKLK